MRVCEHPKNLVQILKQLPVIWRERMREREREEKRREKIFRKKSSILKKKKKKSTITSRGNTTFGLRLELKKNIR